LSAEEPSDGVPTRARVRLRRGTEAEQLLAKGIGSPALFAIALGAAGSTVYYALGVVAGAALGLTPLAFLIAAFFFVLTMLTYVEGSALYRERGGASVFARYAFDELWSFIAGWAILLDYLIVMAVGSFAVAHYLAAFWPAADGQGVELAIAAVVLCWVALTNIRGHPGTRYRALLRLALISLLLFAVIVVIGAVELFDLSLLIATVDISSAPPIDDLVFAVVVACVACTGIEAASGLAGEVRAGPDDLRRLVLVVGIAVVVLFVGVSLVALMAVPVEQGSTRLGSELLEAPVLGVVSELEPVRLGDALRYAVGGVGALVLIQAVNGQMLGLGRLAYSLGRNRQIPSVLSRLDERRSTPYIAISIAAVLAFALAASTDVRFLAGIFAFGAMLAFTVAHVSIIVLRFREPDRRRAFRIPFNVEVRGTAVPLPAVLGALMGTAGWVSVLAYHGGARFVGGAWMLVGVALYVGYRTSQGKSLTRRVTISEEALREAKELAYGSILVPVIGGELDDDIIGTAGRLASDAADDGVGGAVLEAVYVFEMPMSLPIDARVPDERVAGAKRALARAKEVGEEYEGVRVATAMVRGRTAGAAIVNEARRRGVEVIVLAARAPSRVRGGAILGGRGRGSDRFADDMTRYVIEKAPCRVILTAPGGEGGSELGEQPA